MGCEIHHDLSAFKGGVDSVDWTESPLGTNCYVRLPECVVRHSPCIDLASKVCKKLMKDRNDVRAHMKLLETLPKSLDVHCCMLLDLRTSYNAL
jgi:hypothetical protein